MTDHTILWVGGALAMVLGIQWWMDSQDTAARGGANHTRRTTDSAIYGAALDASVGMVTPDDLLHFGPEMRPPHWCPHRVTYPVTPGRELERLIYGAPGTYNQVTPRAERGWLFCPPSEVDY